MPLFWRAYSAFTRTRSRRFWPTGAEFRPDISAVWVYPSAGRGLGCLRQALGAGEHLVKFTIRSPRLCSIGYPAALSPCDHCSLRITIEMKALGQPFARGSFG